MVHSPAENIATTKIEKNVGRTVPETKIILLAANAAFLYTYLKSLNRGVGLVSLNDGFDDVEAVLNVLVVDGRIFCRVGIKGSDPTGITNGPVLKGLFLDVFAVQSGRPLEPQSLTRVVETVLAVLHGVNIQQDCQSIGIRPVWWMKEKRNIY